ncbi:MAG: transposase, partial [Alphaproteobacteria bacterium]|nr:transposase [Alphaproteobacteria bacterium]
IPTDLAIAVDKLIVILRYEVLMLSVRMRDRALPVVWRVRQTKGSIGWRLHHDLLESVFPWLPEGAGVLLTGDRSYGTARLIGWCQEN